MKLFKVTAWLMGTGLLALGLSVVILWGAFELFFGDLCHNEIVHEEFSPDQKLKAVVFIRDCGATTDYSTQISILRAGRKLPDKAGNIFVLEGHSDSTRPKTHWTEARRLEVFYSSEEKPFLAAENYRDVVIEYRVVEQVSSQQPAGAYGEPAEGITDAQP